jgi:trk system potassium uptake protein
VVRIAVIGLSAFGTHLVQTLARGSTRILALDLEESRVNAVRELVDEAAIGDARDARVLSALRLGDYDAVVVSLGEPLDASLLAVLHLRDLKVRRIVAKAVSEDHRRLLTQLGVDDVVFPEADMAERTANTLSSSRFLETFHLGSDVSLVEIAPPRSAIGRTLAGLDLRQRYGISVIAVRDALRGELRVNPDPRATITDSDSLLVLGKDADVDRFVRDR